MKKKILIIAHVSGFLLKFCENDVEILQNLGYEVHYASNRYEKGYDFDEADLKRCGILFHHIDIARSPYMVRANLKALHQVINIIRREKIQLIHCHTPVGGILGRLAGSLCIKERPKVIYTAHGFHFYKGAPPLNNTLYYFAEKILAALTDVLIVINREDYGNACRFRLRKHGILCRIPGTGTDRDRFRLYSKEEKYRLRKKYEIPEDIFVVVSVGELNQNKNHEVVLKAMKKIQTLKEHKNSILYLICGEGFCREQTEAYLKKEGLLNCVRLLGYCRHIELYYAMADVMVFPSVREGLGMAGIEALSMGIPVVASDNRGTREYMEDQRNGLVCGCRDENAFAKGICTIKDMPPQQLAQMKSYCRDSAEKFDRKYSYRIMSGIYTAINREIMDEAPACECDHGYI